MLINAGVPYISTSQPEIFEIRTRENAKSIASKKNQFIKPPEDENAWTRYGGRKEDAYIKPNY